jgi:hypothetical protein
MEGIATVVVAWNGGLIRLVKPPRAIISKLDRGLVFGRPRDMVQQLRVLTASLALLEKDAPQEPYYMDES